MSLDSTAILTLVSSALAIVFEYFPLLHKKYNALPDNQQRLIMLALVVAATAALWVSECVGDTACYAAGWQSALTALFTALAANQATHRILPKIG